MPDPASDPPSGDAPWIAPWPRGWSDSAEPPHSEGSRLLRSLPGRRVWLEDGLVWKGFRAEQAGMRWRDRWRVRAELRGIRRLEAAGVRTPALERRAVRDGWACLATAAVPGGRSLDRLLREGFAQTDEGRSDGSRTDGGPITESLSVGRALGEDLAGWARTGLEHRDLHPGNWVLGADLRWWLLDGHGVRRGGLEGARRDLARLFGECAERASAPWMDAVWDAFRERFGDELGDRQRLDLAARTDRATRLERESDRWLRRSEWGRPAAGWDWLRYDLDGVPDGERWRSANLPRDLGHAWIQLLGRAFEHGLPVAIPSAWRVRGERLEWRLDLGCPLDPAAAQRAPATDAGWNAAWDQRGFAEPPLPRAERPAPTPTGAAPRWERRPSMAPSPVGQVWLPAS